MILSAAIECFLSIFIKCEIKYGGVVFIDPALQISPDPAFPNIFLVHNWAYISHSNLCVH